MSTLIVGLFSKSSQAAAAVYTLEMRGVSEDKINLVASDKFDKGSFAITTNSKLPEGVALGATTGAAITALVAGMTAVGAITTGGLGLVAAGPVIAALAGAGAGAAGGSIIGGIIGSTIPAHEVKYFEDAIEKGAVLLGVEHDDDNIELIKEALKICDAEKVTTA